MTVASHSPALVWLAACFAISPACGTPSRVDDAAHDAATSSDTAADAADSFVPPDALDLQMCTAAATDVASVRAFVVAITHGTMYTPLTAAQFDASRALGGAIARRDFVRAQTLAASASYAVRPIRSALSGTCHLVFEPTSIPGQATLIVRVDPVVRDLLLEAPHVPSDRHTDEEAALIYEHVGARGLLIAGAQRCASSVQSGCRSNTECSPDGPVESDVAHAVSSSFHAFHLALAVDTGATVALQFHTNLQTATDGDALVSNGTRVSSPGTHAVRFVDALVASTAGLSGCLDDASTTSPSQPIRIRSCNVMGATFATTPLCGTTSTQGLASNGVADACLGSASSASDRFVHLEQCSRQLDSVDAWSQHVATAIEAVW